MSKKIKQIKVAKKQSLEICAAVLKPTGISFSFMFFQNKHEKFNYCDREISYWITFLDRLKNLSSLTALEMMNNRSSALRCHPIDWTNTSEPGFDIPNEQQLVETPYQFFLPSNAHGRVHGFFLDEVFYIVWLDPEHLLYPAK